MRTLLSANIQGMFTPDREPHPVVEEIMFLQQPVVFEPISMSYIDATFIRIPVSGSKASLRLNVTNRYVFSELSHLSWSWHLTSNRAVDAIRAGTFELPDAHGEEELVLHLDSVVSRVISLEKSRPELGNDYYITIYGALCKEATWGPAGHTLVTQQFPVKFTFSPTISRLTFPKNITTFSLPKLQVIDDEGTLTIQRVRGSDELVECLAVWEKSTGAMISYCPNENGDDLLAGLLLPNFCRAATDNDRGGMELALSFIFHPFLNAHYLYSMISGHDDFSFWSHWRRAGLDQASPPVVVCTKMQVTESDDQGSVHLRTSCNVVQSSHCSGKVLFKLQADYNILANGRIQISQQVTPLPILRTVASLARVGLNLQLDPSLYRVQYFGRGPGENYPDRKSGSRMGVYNTTAAEMGYEKYIFPVENGSRSDCEWVAFRSTLGDGLCIVSEREHTLSCSALLHSATELDAATHTCDLLKRRNGDAPVHVNLDHQLMGLGGDTSWYPVVYPQYRVKAMSEYQYKLWLVPLEKNDDPSLLARNNLNG
jgi:beta-galactosidase